MKRVVGGLIFIVAVTVLAWFNLAVAVVAICATVLAALYSKADSLIEISFGPLKAKLEREISDAEKILGKLRSLATIQAQIAIGASARTGRFAAPEDWQFLNLKKIESALREIGTSEEDIRQTRRELTNFFLVDLGHVATGSSTVPAHLSQQAQQEWSELRATQGLSEPDKIEKWLKRWDQLTPERSQLIEDMRWVIANHDIRDAAQFARRNLNLPWVP